MPRVSIQTADFNLADEIAALRSGDHRVGAVCSFVGTVRGNVAPTLAADAAALPPEGASLPRGGPSATSVAPTLAADAAALPPEVASLPRGGPSATSVLAEHARALLSMELEHYPGMTDKAIEAMIDEAHQRIDLYAARVVHRVGLLQPGEQIVMVAVTSSHRGESFKACEFLMDYLKTQVPFWKKERTPAGAHWVDARVSDDAALAKWGIEKPNY